MLWYVMLRYVTLRYVTLRYVTKRSRVGVSIGGQCVLLQIYRRIEIFFFVFKYSKLPYESYLTSHTSKPLKKIVKIIETTEQGSKNAQKWIKF